MLAIGHCGAHPSSGLDKSSPGSLRRTLSNGKIFAEKFSVSLCLALPGKFLQWGLELFIFIRKTPCCQYFGLFTSEWVERQ